MEFCILLLILLPFIISAVQFSVRSEAVRRILTYVGSGLIIANAIAVAALWYADGQGSVILPTEG